MTGASTTIALNTTYYAKYFDADEFEIYTDSALSNRITWTGAGSGLTVQSAYWATLGTTDRTRYGTAGSERTYAGMVAARSARFSAASAFDEEVIEIVDAFDEPISAQFSMDIPAASVTFTTLVNGARSSAFHNGNYASGFRVTGGTAFGILFRFTKFKHILDGITMSITGSSCSVTRFDGFLNEVRNCWIVGSGSGGLQTGLVCVSAGACNTFIDNVLLSLQKGVDLQTSAQVGTLIANNTIIGGSGTTGFVGSTSQTGLVYNNVCVGHGTANWGTQTTPNMSASAYNAGESTGGTPWGTNSVATVNTSTHWANYAGNDFRPSSTSPLIDAGVTVLDISDEDMVGYARPSYNNGAAEAWDIGAFEYDYGYTRPAVRTLDLSGLVTGSQVVTYTSGTATELDRVASTAGSTYSYDVGTTGVTVDFTVLKAGYKPIRVTGVALDNESTPLTIQQELDRAYVTPSGLTFGTTIGVGGCNFIAPVTSLAVTSLRVAAATTPQNWYSALMDAFIDSSTNTTLKNVPFPVAPFGEASFTILDGVEFSDGATSIAFFSRDGLRYSSDDGTTETAVWAAILTLDTPAGFQIKYRQAPAGTITNAANTGPMDQLVQVYGDATHGNFDYRGHMVLRCPKPGYSQPMPDLVATYGNLYDGLFVAALEPVLQYATVNADLDAANLVLNNTTKTFTVTAAHTLTELYQRAQWWANQDAQWDADIPLTTTNGSTFTMPSTWTMVGPTYLSGGTLAGGSITLATGTQAISFSGMTITLGAAGTYTFDVVGGSTIIATPSAPGTYVLSAGSINGTLDLRNSSGTHAITVEVPAGTTTTTANNTGAAITVTNPAFSDSVTIYGLTSGSRVQLYDTLNNVELYNNTVVGTSLVFSETYTVDRTIRVRISYVSGTTAKEFIEATVGSISVGTPDISYTASQVNDDTYNSNAVDGSTVTGITFTDAATDLVNINLAGGTVPWKNIYAAFVYWINTATGIADDIAYIEAVDPANYLLTSMKIKNTSSPSVALTITGGYGRDATSGTILDIIDTTGGNIFPLVDHVVSSVVTVGGVNVITGDIADIPAAPTTTQIWADSSALSLPKFLALK